MLDHLEIVRPVLLTGSSPCEAFSQLRHIEMAKRDPEQVGTQRNQRQYDVGWLFLHEQPDGADSWYDNELRHWSDCLAFTESEDLGAMWRC